MTDVKNNMLTTFNNLDIKNNMNKGYLILHNSLD